MSRSVGWLGDRGGRGGGGGRKAVMWNSGGGAPITGMVHSG